MSIYYQAQRTKNRYVAGSHVPFRISRSKIELFMQCPRCFYLDRRLGVAQPPGYPFTLNTAVDTLLKKEFDIHRAKGTAHPLMQTYGIDAVPYEHPQLMAWRDALRGGIQYVHPPTNFLVTGGIDDVWINPQSELLVVDYKATAKDGEVTIDAAWQQSYKRQMEIYQWLFRRNGFRVSSTGYFVYCNGDTDKEAFDAKLEFVVKILPYTGDDAWVEPVLISLQRCLAAATLPPAAAGCDFCAYRAAARQAEG